jgi:hypothetical protein
VALPLFRQAVTLAEANRIALALMEREYARVERERRRYLTVDGLARDSYTGPRPRGRTTK